MLLQQLQWIIAKPAWFVASAYFGFDQRFFGHSFPKCFILCCISITPNSTTWTGTQSWTTFLILFLDLVLYLVLDFVLDFVFDLVLDLVLDLILDFDLDRFINVVK